MIEWSFAFFCSMVVIESYIYFKMKHRLTDLCLRYRRLISVMITSSISEHWKERYISACAKKIVLIGLPIIAWLMLTPALLLLIAWMSGIFLLFLSGIFYLYMLMMCILYISVRTVISRTAL